jgi:hypothetical protein
VKKVPINSLNVTTVIFCHFLDLNNCAAAKPKVYETNMLWNNLVHFLVLVTSLDTCFCNNIAMIGRTVSGYRTHTESRAMAVNANSSNVDAKQTGRIFFDAIGGWLMNSDYFPIEVNVIKDWRQAVVSHNIEIFVTSFARYLTRSAQLAMGSAVCGTT